MRLHVRTQGIPVTDELRSHVDRHVHFALSRFADRIHTVHVSFRDVNGARGGIDKACRVRVGLRGRAALHLDDVDTSLRGAVSRVCERISHHVGRELERQRVRSRRTRGHRDHHHVRPTPTPARQRDTRGDAP